MVYSHRTWCRTAGWKRPGPGAVCDARERAGLRPGGENSRMMRFAFGGAVSFSLIGAAVLGGVLAWSGEESVSGSNSVGAIDFELVNQLFLNPKLGPDGAPAADVFQADVLNEGDFRLSFSHFSGVTLNQVNFRGGGPNGAAAVCNPSNFAGGVRYDPEAVNPNGPGDGVVDIGELTDGRPLRIAIGAVPGASSDCQGKNVTWTARIIFNSVPGAWWGSGD